jgi:hypothetical protein
MQVQRNRIPGLERSLYYFFGYDFFISYRWSDARVYAVGLREALVSRGLVFFLDSDYAKGDDWREEGRRALHRSSRLLLVCSAQKRTTRKPSSLVSPYPAARRSLRKPASEGAPRRAFARAAGGAVSSSRQFEFAHRTLQAEQ